MTIKRKEATGRKGWGGQGRGRRKSTDSQSSHGQEGRSLKGKQAPSQHAVATAASHTAHTASRFLCHSESQGKSHRDKREARSRETLRGTYLLPFPSVMFHSLDLVTLRTLGRCSDLALAVPKKENVCSEICRIGWGRDSRQTQTTFHPCSTEQDR